MTFRHFSDFIFRNNKEVSHVKTSRKSIIDQTNFMHFCATLSYNTVSVTIIMLDHPHVMGRGSGIPSIETAVQTTSHIPKEMS